ncbi:MAG: hypothetical protein HQM16_06745 [Deltaproteobacteria bacterium]|nr:hypothetical protein [Deltaproteobacteria bacterium]
MLTKLVTQIRFMAFAGFILVISCGGSQGLNSSITSDSLVNQSATYETAVGGQVQGLSLSGTDVKFTIADLDHDIVIALHSYDQGETETGFSLSTAHNNAGETASLKKLGSQEASAAWDSEDPFENFLRESEAKLEREDAAAPSMIKYAVTEYELGSTREFKVIDSFSDGNSYEKITTRLKYQNEDFEFYVDVRDEESISDENLTTLALDFENIIGKERDLFGTESDINGDGRFAVVFTQEVNNLGTEMGGIVTGYFYAMDLFDASKYPSSNEMEVIFTFVPDPSGEYGSPLSESFAVKNIIKGVLPHEFQHMINFNQHYFVNEGETEQGWLNEALSHLAEDLYTLNDDNMIEGFGLENPARVASFFSNISELCFTCGTSLSERGGAYLFVKYLFEQAEIGNLPEAESGAAFLEGLLTSNERGVSNIVSAVFGPGSPDSDFKELLGLFSLAIYLSDTNQTGDDLYQFQGIDLRGLVKDNRGTYLKGPGIQVVSDLPYTSSLKGNGLAYIQIPSSLLAASGGELVFTAGDGSDFGAYVIQ